MWLKEGDANTRYFHSSLLDKRARLTIQKIKRQNGKYIKGDNNIGTVAMDFSSPCWQSPR